MISNVHASVVNCFEWITHRTLGKHIIECFDTNSVTFNWL